MVTLLINKDKIEKLTGTLTDTSFGGLPLKIKGKEFNWPICRCCNGAMQFLGKLSMEDKTLQIFMCQNDVGVCEVWDANDGTNAVLVHNSNEKELEIATAPEKGETTRAKEYGASIAEIEAASYEEARNIWAEKNKASIRHVLGQIGGEPEWIQGDETPECNQCKKPMRFVAQLEEGPESGTEMNFGGGCSYLFDCSCSGSAKFLWQC